jgi:DNA invertase Pin-like site-specific DNA recombinase
MDEFIRFQKVAKKRIEAPEPNLDIRNVGYARVSTEDQRLDLQIDALTKAGVRPENLHVEKVSGASKKRPQLDYAIMDLRAGDTLLVWRLDRLARSMRDLYRRLDEIYGQGANFKSLTEQFDFGTATGKFVLGILGLVAELERQLTIQRTKAGIESWRERGGKPGRQPTFDAETQDKALKMMRAGKSVAATAKAIGVAKSSIYGYFQVVKKRGRKIFVRRER